MPRRIGRPAATLWVAGAALPIATALFLTLIAPRFVWAIKLGDRPILTFAIGMGALSIAFLTFALLLVRRSDSGPRALGPMLLIGLTARIALIPSTPILEDDFYRYLWDGAVTVAGKNPFTHAPARFVAAPGIDRLLAAVKLAPTPPPTGYERLARDGRNTLLRVNNPHIATIYPPLAQLGFAAGQWLTPWQLAGWKIVSIAAELLTVALLLGALRAAQLPPIWAAIYWWHPLALKEFANSAHMDVVLLPFLAGALWMVIAGRTRAMALCVAGAAAIKFWPLLIVPTLVRRNRAGVAIALGIAVLALILVLPQLLALSSESGLSRYAADWQRNALVFALLVWSVGWLPGDPAMLAKLIVAAVLGLWVARAWLRDPAGPFDRIGAAGTATLLLILLGPTGYPWYALWLAPFAVVQPRLPLLLLLAAAPAYYLDFWFQVRDNPSDWRWLAPLLSAGPVWIALAAQRLRKDPA